MIRVLTVSLSDRGSIPVQSNDLKMLLDVSLLNNLYYKYRSR